MRHPNGTLYLALSMLNPDLTVVPDMYCLWVDHDFQDGTFLPFIQQLLYLILACCCLKGSISINRAAKLLDKGTAKLLDKEAAKLLFKGAAKLLDREAAKLLDTEQLNY